ncbi:mitochondrial S-adenosylmethionine carrier protein isoform 3-T3 [Molossus nigricans]
MDRPGFTASLVAGGVAGVSVDLILFPLDTIKTRLQSSQGFHKAGGFHGIYAGVASAAIGSFPNAAAFFITYEYVKWFLHTDSSSYMMPVKHMLAASAGEVIPFSLVQFPLWESLKALWSWRQDRVVDPWQSAVCGAFADYLQVSSLEWQQSVWEVSSFLVLTIKRTACCWNSAKRAHESHAHVPSSRGACCERVPPGQPARPSAGAQLCRWHRSACPCCGRLGCQHSARALRASTAALWTPFSELLNKHAQGC